jgi:hypothetical protein
MVPSHAAGGGKVLEQLRQRDRRMSVAELSPAMSASV